MEPQIFSRIPNNVLIQIFTLIQEAHPSTLYSLLFIKSTKTIAETFLCGRITVCGSSPWAFKHWPAQKVLLKRLSNAQDALNSYVRELTVMDWPGPASLDFGVDALEELVGSVKQLLVFKWESWQHIPPSVLSKLHTHSPTARLVVKNRERGRPPRSQNRNDMAIDLTLLRSPQLHSLEFIVLQNGFLSAYSPDRTISEFPVLTQLLQRSPNLRVLKIGCVQEPSFVFGKLYQRYAEFNTEGDGPLNLQFAKNDSFPPLEEFGILKEPFRIDVRGYDLNAAHCIAWKRAMNWRALTRLDLGNARPNDFFLIFRGYIPQLQSLRFRLSCGADGKADHHPAALLQLTRRFLDSITGLRELAVADWTRCFFPHLWESIRRHGHSLTALEVNPSERGNKNIPGWSAEPLTLLLDGLPGLTTLALAVDLLKPPGYWDSSSPGWPEKPFSLLARYSTLESLQIRMRLPPTTHRKREIDRQGVAKMATDLFREFYELGRVGRLQVLDLQVQREERSLFDVGLVGVTVKVRRCVRDDAVGVLDGGFVVRVEGGFEEF